ncbi:riboflavin synthase [Bdellovibrionota bacterium]
MFSGIVEDLGVLKSREWLEKEPVWRLCIETSLSLDDMGVGGSISHNGACLTVIKKEANLFWVDVSLETADKSNLGNIDIGGRINLERALKLSQRLDGHLVMGHCDKRIRRLEIKEIGEGAEVWYELPSDLSRYVIVKGSISVNGVSLTVNEIHDGRFSVFLIPHTIRETNLLDDSAEEVNIEVDMIGKYVERLIAGDTQQKRIVDAYINN